MLHFMWVLRKIATLYPIYMEKVIEIVRKKMLVELDFFEELVSKKVAFATRLHFA